jgi:hypothetical protein
MAPPSLGSSSTRPKTLIENFPLPPWVNYEVSYWYDEWKMIRDMCAGEKMVKDAGSLYLPQMEGMDSEEYQAFLERATFFPFTARTASALAGSIFRRQEAYENFPEKLRDRLEDFTKDKQDFRTFSQLAAEEVIKLGRYGVLLDLPATPSTVPKPYVVGYTAENILDWAVSEIDGRNELTMLVLREAKFITDPKTRVQSITPRYRRLSLTSTGPDRAYKVEIFEAQKASDQPDLTQKFLVKTIFPEVRGKTLNFIPFVLIGAFTSTPGVEKPPMQDIARLNVSHYRSYASLEHGRLFTGFPIYYVEAPLGGGEADAEFELGASKVWVTPPGAKPGLLELNGQGLKFLENALDQKEQQAATLGGRMIGIRTASTSESNNVLKISERNEQSILLKITRALDAGMTHVLRWWAIFQDTPADEANKIKVDFNKDFLFDNGGAREFRAIQSMYKDGVIPIEVVYAYLKKSMVIPDWMDQEEFKRLLDKADSFPNETNFEARQEGFADAKSRDQANLEDQKQEGELELQENQQEADKEKAKEAAKNAEKIAAKQPPPGAPGAPGVPGGPPRPGVPPQRPGAPAPASAAKPPAPKPK